MTVGVPSSTCQYTQGRRRKQALSTIRLPIDDFCQSVPDVDDAPGSVLGRCVECSQVCMADGEHRCTLVSDNDIEITNASQEMVSCTAGLRRAGLGKPSAIING